MEGGIQSTEKTNQGNATAMGINGVAIIPLILMIVKTTGQDDSSTKTAAYADDFTAAGKISQLKINGTHYVSLVPNLANILKVENSGLL